MVVVVVESWRRASQCRQAGRLSGGERQAKNEQTRKRNGPREQEGARTVTSPTTTTSLPLWFLLLTVWQQKHHVAPVHAVASTKTGRDQTRLLVESRGVAQEASFVDHVAWALSSAATAIGMASQSCIASVTASGAVRFTMWRCPSITQSRAFATRRR